MKKLPKIKRGLALAFGSFNYDPIKNVYRLPSGEEVSPVLAEVIGVIIRPLDEFGRIVKGK